MSALTVAWTSSAVLAQKIPDPNDVKPGWIGFVVIMSLMIAVVVLVLSFRKQLRKVNSRFTPDEDTPPAGVGNGAGKEDGPARS